MKRFLTLCLTTACMVALVGLSLPQAASKVAGQDSAPAAPTAVAEVSSSCCPSEKAVEIMTCCDEENASKLPCGSKDCQCKYTAGLSLFVMNVMDTPSLMTSVNVAYVGFTPMPYETLLPPPRKPPKIA